MNYLKNKPDYFANLFNFEICLIRNSDNNNDTNKLIESDLYDNDPNKFYNKLIFLSFIIHLQYKNFYSSLKDTSAQKEEKIYLINKKYLDEIKSILHLEEIAKALNKSNEIIKKFFYNDIFDYALIKKNLDENILIQFLTTKKMKLIIN